MTRFDLLPRQLLLWLIAAFATVPSWQAWATEPNDPPTPITKATSDKASTDSSTTSAGAKATKFELDIQPLLTSRGCNSGPCHGKQRGQNGFALSLLGFDAEMDFRAIVQEARGRRIFPNAPEQSLFVQKATGELPHGGGIRIEPDSSEYRLIVEWIRSGQQRVSATDPVLTQIAISPQPHSMAPNDQEQLTVTATYSDGSTRNVTNYCAFQSNEPAVLNVSGNGLLKAGQLPGEATVMARYMGHIATWSSAIPRPEAVSESVYEQYSQRNFIDKLVGQRWRELNLAPSAICSDEKFLRRSYLDIIGRLPTAEEAKQFIQAADADKREQLVDALLSRPEYADFWANKWADLLRPNPYRVGIKATRSLDGWLREAFQQNVPYDQFVRKLLTAQGSTWQNGAVTLFRDRREPEEIVSITSQLFMGVRLDCAKCHQHPFEVYGQADFYGLAAFFGRVGHKGVGLSPPISGGEEIVFVKSSGQVRHPLSGDVLPPRALKSEVKEIAAEDDPREALVDWLVAPENPYFAQVAVNRIWADLFGIGLVDPVDDLRATNPPSNPALLQALADHFRQVGFDQKKLLKTMVLSQTYALQTRPNSTNYADNRNYSRYYRQRLRAEVLMDAVCDVTEVEHNFSGLAKGTRSMQLWTNRVDSEFLDAFGRPDANQDPPCERTKDSTVTQALHLMNSPALHEKITNENGRCNRLAKSDLDPSAIIDELYLATFSRFPTADERSILLTEFAKPETNRKTMIEDVLWSLMNSPEFSYKD